MKQGFFEIISNIEIAKDIFEMKLSGDTSEVTAPGQFINIKLSEKFLRRPISVCDYEKGKVTIIYKVVGDGTKIISRKKAGDSIDVLTGLGNGFDTSKSGDTPVLLGGGVGVPPMYALSKKLISEGKNVTVITGFNQACEVFYTEEFRKIGANVICTTADGSVGKKGFVTDALADIDYSYFYACGPLPMLKAVYSVSTTEGQLSFEERMGCGFGACMGCSCRTKYGNKRICKDGPVLLKEEIIW